MRTLKEFFHDLRQRYLISNIDDDVKKYIANELNAGVITEVLSKDMDYNYTCRSDLAIVSEYASKKNVTYTYEVKTSKGEKFTIYQSYIGLNFEAPCDQYVANLYSSNNELLHMILKKREEKKEKKGKENKKKKQNKK